MPETQDLYLNEASKINDQKILFFFEGQGATRSNLMKYYLDPKILNVSNISLSIIIVLNRSKQTATSGRN